MESISFNNSLILTKNILCCPSREREKFFIIVKVDGEKKTPHHHNVSENIRKINKKSCIFFFIRFFRIEKTEELFF